MLEQSVPEGLHPLERTHAGAVREELQPVGRTHIGEVHGGLSPVGGTPRWSRGRVRSPPPEEEGAAETACDELTAAPIPRPPAPLAGRRKTMDKLEGAFGGASRQWRLETLACEERQGELGWSSLEKRWLQGHLTAPQCPRGVIEEVELGSSQWCRRAALINETSPVAAAARVPFGPMPPRPCKSSHGETDFGNTDAPSRGRLLQPAWREGIHEQWLLASGKEVAGAAVMVVRHHHVVTSWAAVHASSAHDRLQRHLSKGSWEGGRREHVPQQVMQPPNYICSRRLWARINDASCGLCHCILQLSSVLAASWQPDMAIGAWARPRAPACSQQAGGQPVPMLDNPFSEEKIPNIQSKPPLAQLEAISSCPITCYLGEETDPLLSTTSFQAKQPQLPQPLLIRLVLQTLHQLRCPSLNTLQHLHVSLVVGGPKLNTAFEGHNHFPSPAGHAIFDTSQDAIGFLGHLGTLLAHIQVPASFPKMVYLSVQAMLISQDASCRGDRVQQCRHQPGVGATLSNGDRWLCDLFANRISD
ncbi:hypothetical protein QYF61_018756, partial [Mycteria americana]